MDKDDAALGLYRLADSSFTFNLIRTCIWVKILGPIRITLRVRVRVRVTARVRLRVSATVRLHLGEDLRTYPGTGTLGQSFRLVGRRGQGACEVTAR